MKLSPATHPVLTPLIRYGTFPTLFLGINGAALVVIAGAGPALETALALTALACLALCISFACESALPFQESWNQSHGDIRRDWTHFLVNESISLGPLLVIPLIAATQPDVAIVPTHGASPPVAPSLWPIEWPWLLQFLAALVVFDLGQNLFHWAAHVWAPLWRWHAPHHQVERLYGLNGVLKHPAYQIAASVFAMAPLLWLGMPKAFSLGIAITSMTQLLLQHSNADYRTGPIRYFIATAEVHRFHHRRGEAGNVNYALFFSFFDWLFGNAHDERTSVRPGEVGLDEADYPIEWLDQLLAPMRRGRRAGGA